MCFLFITDLIEGRNLLWIESSQVPIAIRWRVLLQSYKNSVTHILGLQNTVADWLSRMYPINPVNDLQSATTEVCTSLLDMFATVHGKRSLHYVKDTLVMDFLFV